MNENIEKFKNSDENIYIDYEVKNFDNEINYILEIMKNIFKNDKLNIYIKIKELKKEFSYLKDKLNQTYIDSFILSKIAISKYDFSFLSRVDEKMAFDTNNKPYGKSPLIWRFDSDNNNQLFQIIKNKDDTYCIKKRDSNYYIGMENKDGEWIISSRNKGENFQKFKFILKMIIF